MFELIVLELSAFTAMISISAIELLLAVLIIMSIIVMYKTHDYSIFHKSYTIYFLFMILAETLSTVFGVDPANSVKGWSSFWVYMHLFVVYIIYDGKNRESIFIFFLVGTIVSLGYTFYLDSISIVSDHRAKGFFSHALTYGNVMAVLFTAAFGFALFTPQKERRSMFINYFAIITAFYCVFQSGSRGSILAMIVTSLAMIIYRFKLKGAAFVTILLIAGTVLVMNHPTFSGRFTEIGSDIRKGSNTSVGTRLVLWEASTKAIMAKPLFGYGKGNFRKVISPMINVPVRSMAHAHNSYIQYTFTNGFFGLVVLFLFIASLFRHLVRMSVTNPYAKTAIFILVAFMLEGLTENNFGDSEVVMAAFLSIALLITPVKEHPYRFFSKKKLS